jgi:hypothetical protein
MADEQIDIRVFHPSCHTETTERSGTVQPLHSSGSNVRMFGEPSRGGLILVTEYQSVEITGRLCHDL